MRAHAGEIPHRVVENDQDIVNAIELRERVRDCLCLRPRCQRGQTGNHSAAFEGGRL